MGRRKSAVCASSVCFPAPVIACLKSIYPGGQMTAQITIRGARLHNLKNVTLTIPKNQLVVLTGVSGSGKSTLGFDILHKEGQRQYLESLDWLPLGWRNPRSTPSPGFPHPSAWTSTSPTAARVPRLALPPKSIPIYACCLLAWDTAPARPVEKTSRPPSTLPTRNGRVNPARTTMPPLRKKPFPAHTAAHLFRRSAWLTSPLINPPGPVQPAPGWAASTRPTSSAWSTSKRASRMAPLLVGTSFTSTTTPPPCRQPLPITGSNSISRSRSKTTPRHSATCCSLA